MKRTALFIITIFCLLQGKAQLPSERPMSSLYSGEVKQKLAKPKGDSKPNQQLPSMAPLPKQAVFAQRNRPVPQNSIQGKEAAQILPSNSKTVRQPKRPPRTAG